MPPTALNNGEHVELLLGRIAAPYFDVDDFDDLPTPFRTVAVDLLSAQPVVLRPVAGRGDAGDDVAAADLSAGRARRAGPDRRWHDEQRARDIVKAMGADRVIAINVGDLSDREGVSYTLLGDRGRYDRRDDAGIDQARARGSRRRDQRAARAIRFARLAAG